MKKVMFAIAFSVFLISLSSASPILFHISPGISGQISKLFILNISGEKAIFAATSTGLFVIDKNGVLVNSFPTPYSITDVVSIDDKDIVMSTTDQNFPNILELSVLDGKKLWEFKPEIPAYDQQMMWINKETKTWDLEVTDDLDGDGKKDVLATSGSVLYLLSGKTGEKIWNFSATNDIWSVKYSNELIILGCQDGVVYALNKKGELVWKNNLVSEYKVVDLSSKQEIGTVKRSVWDILVEDNSVLISSEDGYIYQLDKTTGKVLKSKKVIDYDENLLNNYYGSDSNNLYPTGPSNDNYFDVRMQEFDKDNIVVETFLGESSGGNNKEKGKYGATTRKLFILDKNSLDEIKQTSEINLISSKQVFSHADSVFVPVEKEGSTEILKSFNMTGEVGTLFINSTSSSNYGKQTTLYYFAEEFDNGGFILASDDGDLLLVNYDQTVRWSFPRYEGMSTEEIDINKDGVQDYLIKSVVNEGQDDPLEEGKVRLMILLDGKTRKIIWNYNISYEDYASTGGLAGEKIIGDTDGDGYSDIIGYLQHPNNGNGGDAYGENSNLVLISGRTGDEIWRKPVINRTYYGSNEEILTNPDYSQQQMDKLTRRLSSLKDQESPDQGEIDSVRQQIQQLENQLNNTFNRQKDFLINKRILSIDEINDQNGDGVNDILVSCPNEVYALSGKDSSIIWFRTRDSSKYKSSFDSSSTNSTASWSFMNQGGDFIFKVVGDVNKDGKQDFVAITNDKIMSILSTEGEYTIGWTWKPGEWNFDMNRVKLIDDITGDGIKDLLLSVDSKGNSGAYKVIDGSIGKEVMTLSRDASAIRWNVADFNGDGVKDSLIFKKWSNDGPTLDVISGKDSSVLYSYRGIDDTSILDQNGYIDIMPASYTDGLNGDGAYDLIIAKTSMESQDAEIVFVDVKNKKEIEEISLSQDSNDQNNNWKRYQPAISVSKIGKKENGVNEVAIAGIFTNSYGQEQSKVIVYDIETKRILYEYLIPAAQIYSSGEKDIIISGKSGEAYIMNGSWSNPIIEPTNGDKLNNILDLKWNNAPDSIYTIIVNGQEVKQVDSNEALLSLKNGNHEVALKTEDRFGNSCFDYIKIDMNRNKIAGFFINILIILAICSLIGYNVYIHKKKDVK